MSTPLIFVLLPGFIGLINALLKSRARWLDVVSVAAAGLLAVAAFAVPVDEPWIIRGLALRLDPAFTVLGRSLVIDSGLLNVVGAVYAAGFIWLVAALFISGGETFVSFGLLSISMLVAAVSVRPWGFVGIFLLFAVFLWVPLLAPPGIPWKQSVINFLGFQVIGMPFLLIAGAMIGGLESTPPGLRIVERPAIFLGMGFALVLALFPFHSWMPRLVEEVNAFAAAFVLFLLPAFAGLIFLQVIDQHVWLRDSRELFTLLRTIGIVTTAIGGILASFQRNLGRILGFAALVETGIMLLAIGSGPRSAPELFFPLLVSRGIGFMVWGSGLAAVQETCGGMDFRRVQGLFRRNWVVGTAILAGSYTSAGLPLLVGFVTRLRLYSALSPAHPSAAVAVWFGSLGLLFAATRSLAVLVMRPDRVDGLDAVDPDDANAPVQARFQSWLILAACTVLFLAGIFPFWLNQVVNFLPLAFEHLRP